MDITYLGNTAVNKKIKSHLEFRMTRQADEMNFYIESSGGNHYYFNYRITEGKGVVSIFSNMRCDSCQLWLFWPLTISAFRCFCWQPASKIMATIIMDKS